MSLGGGRQARSSVKMYLKFWPGKMSEKEEGTALKIYGECGIDSVPGLIEYLADKRQYVRQCAYMAIVNKGDVSVPYLRKALTAGDPYIRGETCRALGDIGGPDLIEVLASMTGDHDYRVKLCAISGLSKLGPAAISRLMEIARLGDEEARYLAIRQLTDMRTVAASETFVEGLADTAPRVRSAAARAIGELKCMDVKDLPKLLCLFKDEDEGVRLSAVGAVGRLRLNPTLSVPALIEALGDRKPGVRTSAAGALWHFGTHAKMAEEALVGVLNDEDAGVRGHAASALGQIGVVSQDTLKHLNLLLTDDNKTVRQEASEALSKLGHVLPQEPAPSSVPVHPR